MEDKDLENIEVVDEQVVEPPKKQPRRNIIDDATIERLKNKEYGNSKIEYKAYVPQKVEEIVLFWGLYKRTRWA